MVAGQNPSIDLWLNSLIRPKLNIIHQTFMNSTEALVKNASAPWECFSNMFILFTNVANGIIPSIPVPWPPILQGFYNNLTMGFNSMYASFEGAMQTNRIAVKNLIDLILVDVLTLSAPLIVKDANFLPPVISNCTKLHLANILNFANKAYTAESTCFKNMRFDYTPAMLSVAKINGTWIEVWKKINVCLTNLTTVATCFGALIPQFPVYFNTLTGNLSLAIQSVVTINQVQMKTFMGCTNNTVLSTTNAFNTLLNTIRACNL
jgi:hypothetical protein